jgi:hypothetical protein
LAGELGFEPRLTESESVPPVTSADSATVDGRATFSELIRSPTKYPRMTGLNEEQMRPIGTENAEFSMMPRHLASFGTRVSEVAFPNQ